MSATQVIEEIQRLPDEQVEQVYEYLFSTERELDRALTAFDSLPRKNCLTEEEILNLSRARRALQQRLARHFDDRRFLSSDLANCSPQL